MQFPVNPLKVLRKRSCAGVFLIVPFLLMGTRGPAQSDEPIDELEEFIAEETAFEESDTLIPTEREIDSILGLSRSLLETPRSVTAINPETIKEFKLETVYDLADFVPGAQVINYFGIPGVPTTRGLLTSVYFNGVQRVWNRNGYPTSFASLESIDYIKGPPPAFYSAASPGGYVNFIPKSPYFDKFRGSLQFTVGSYEKYRTQLDVGGPTLLFNKPAAWRLSFTHQDAESFYNNFDDDYVSLYGSTKIRLNEKISLFIGGEFYRHRSNENPGWNRVTQDLIDDRKYLTGAPLEDLTGETVTFPSPFGGVTTVTNSTPGAVSREALETASPFGGIRGQFGRGSAFDPNAFSPSQAASFAFLGGLDNTGNPLHPNFNGVAQTTRLSLRDTLIDPSDFADADTYLFFFDTVARVSDTMTITNKVFIDAYTREKQSTYGYAEDGQNFTLEEKLFAEHQIPDLLSGSTLVYGGSIRYEDAKALTDFTVEPFGRADISNSFSPNETIAAGDDRDIFGERFWDPNGSFESELITYSLFSVGEFRWGEKFTLIASGRFDHANWDRSIADEAQDSFFVSGGDTLPSGGKTYYNWSFSSVYDLLPGVSLYATYQEGTSFQGFYVSGNVQNGDTNFQESSLAEGGIKVSLFKNTLYSSLSIFHQDLTNFDDRGGEAVPQRGRGVEFEFTYAPLPWLTFLANASWQEHFFRTRGLPAGFVPLSPEELLLYGGSPYFDFGQVENRPNPGGPRYGIPEWTVNAYARVALPNGITVGFGPRWVDEVAANPDKTLTIPSYITWNGRISYAREKWEVSFTAENIFDEEYFIVSDTFSANAIITPAPLATWELTFTYKF